MKLAILVVFVLAIVSCSTTGNISKNDNSIVVLGEKFDAQILSMVEEIAKNPISDISEIGEFLFGCETGYATKDGYKVGRKANQNCLILLVKRSNVEGSTFLEGLLRDGGGADTFVVATTMDIAGYGYPVILVPEGTYHRRYFIRALVHEGLHAIRMKNQEDKLPFFEEEELAYTIQFKVLESQYSQEELTEFSYAAIPGIPEYAFSALEAENRLYMEYRGHNLLAYLKEISYGDN